MNMVRNVLSLDKQDCESIQEALDKGNSIKSFLSEQVREMYQGDIDDLDGIEIPSDYWHFVMELDAPDNRVAN